MIDIENDVFTVIKSALKSSFQKIDVSKEYDHKPSSFPYVTIVESDNRVYQRMRTLNIENAAEVMYSVNVYSNKLNGKKEEAKAIAAVVDEAFQGSGFTRTLMEQIPNEHNASIYRLVMRYEAIVGKEPDGRFLVYQNNT